MRTWGSVSEVCELSAFSFPWIHIKVMPIPKEDMDYGVMDFCGNVGRF